MRSLLWSTPLRYSVILCVLLGCGWPLTARASEIDLLSDGLSFADCLDPNATVLGGFSVGVVCNTRVYGVTDEFRGVQAKIVTRGGAFNPDLRSNLLTAARPGLGESRFSELQGQLLRGEFLRSGSLGVFRALSAAAARARGAGETDTAAELQAQADAIVAGSFDDPNNIHELLAALAPRDRLGELLSPEFPGLLARDFANTVSPFGARLATDIFNVSGTGALSSNLARRATVPFLVGPDGIRNTADDLPIFDPAKGMRAVSAGAAGGGNPFPDTDYDDVIVVDQGGADVQFFGRFRDDVIVQIGCSELGGTLDLGTGACIPPANAELTGAEFEKEVFKSGCRFQTGEFAEGGIDGEGRCIRLGVFFTVPFAGVPLFGDLGFRPADAILEPFDLTDFALIAKSVERGIPARPRNPLGSLTFNGGTGDHFARRVDPDTGAPVNFVGSGSNECKIRMVGGRSAGPDGDPDTLGDNGIPSIGNCLLFDNPTNPNGVQKLRGSDDIALSHYANQTLFHTLCTLWFDPDLAFCPFDFLNAPGFFGIVSNLVAGGEISSFATDGLRFIRTPAAPFDGVLRVPETRDAIFQEVANTDLSNLTQFQKARLGCGDSFVNPCGAADLGRYLADPALQRLIEGRGPEQLSGGPDLLNADADSLTQEFLNRKTVETGGDVEPLPWLLNPDLAAEGSLVYQIANQNELDPRCHLTGGLESLFNPDNPACFNEGGSRRPLTFNDPTDASNPLNAFRSGLGESCIQNFGDTDRFARGQRAAAFDADCTELETLSANLERVLIAFGLMGFDRVPDPPETFEELINVLASDRTRLPGGDPVAGPDGIFVANLASGLGNLIAPDRFETGEKEMQVVRIETDPLTAGIGLVKLDDFTGSPVPLEATETARIAAAMENFLLGGGVIAAYDPDTCVQETCHLVIGEDRQVNAVDAFEVQVRGPKEIVSVLPVALEIVFVEIDDAGNPIGGGIRHFNIAALNIQAPVAFQELLNPEHFDPTAPPGLEGTVEVEVDGQIFRLFPTTTIRDRFLGLGNDGLDCQDLDNDGICDFDQDGDGVYDGADDYSRGPGTDDNILCGSGLPGDILQDALQFEFVRPSDDSLFKDTFPEGLPLRSFVFCGGSQKLIGLTAQSSPRRDFIWHGAARPEDPDADGWPDQIDVCPFTANTNQQDRGGVRDATPDGIGDACQCGDVTGDGVVNSFDATMIKRHALGLSAPVFNVPELCDVTGDGACNSFDATMITRAALGLSAPLFGQNCPPANP